MPAALVSSTQGWKWSLPSTASNPASSSATACPANSMADSKRYTLIATTGTLTVSGGGGKYECQEVRQ
jgi:hypothetical protein